MPILTPPTPSNLLELASTLSAIANNSSIYLYKNSNGNVNATRMENYIISGLNYGYSYSFINGETVYTMLPITSYSTIPFTNMISTLGALYTAKLFVWLDGKDDRTISQDLQKIISKSYETQVVLIENTSSQSFTYTGNTTIDLTTGANIETQANVLFTQYFKIALILTIPTQNVNNVVLFQHNNFQLRITQQTSPETTVTYMIGTFDNGVFKRGITFKPTDPTFKYYIYTDNTGILIVSSNTSVMTANPTYAYGSSVKLFIGQDSAGINNSAIKVHEIIYYQSTANDIATNSTDMYSYFNTKWTLSTYNDLFNIPPIPPLTIDTPYTSTNDIVLNTHVSKDAFNIVTFVNFGGSLLNFTRINSKSFVDNQNSNTYFFALKTVVPNSYYPNLLIGFARFTNNYTNDSQSHNGSNYQVFWCRPLYGIDIRHSGTAVQSGATYESSVTNRRLTISLNLSNKNVTCRIYETNGTTILSSHVTAALNSAYWGGYTYYPVIQWMGTTAGGQYELDTSFTIAGEINILS